MLVITIVIYANNKSEAISPPGVTVKRCLFPSGQCFHSHAEAAGGLMGSSQRVVHETKNKTPS